MFKLYDEKGALLEIKPDVNEALAWYREAKDAGISVPALLAQKYPTDRAKYGSTFEQFCASTGLFLRPNREAGIRPPTVAEAMEGKVMFAGTVIREANPASRILFPSVIIEAIENKLKSDLTTDASIFGQLVAVELSIAGEKYEQPVLNFSKPEQGRHAGIGQLALPNTLLSITASDVTRKIPTVSLGMEISDQAAAITSLDLVSLALTRQAEVERAERAMGYLQSIVNGDADVGQAALSSITSDSLDNAVAAGALSHKAWVKFIRKSWKKRHINWVMSDLDTLFKIENREAKPNIQTDDPKSPRINPTFDVVNPQWQNVKHFLLDDGVFATDKIVGLDSRFGIVRVRNILAEYQAVEEFVLRRSKAMRFDFGEMCYRLFDEAFEVMTISA